MRAFPAWLSFLLAGGVSAQEFDPFRDDLAARASDPIYTTYAAPLERSTYMVDEAYHFDFYSSPRPPRFITDTGGELGFALKHGPQLVAQIRDFHEPPVVRRSYPHGLRYSYEPVAGLRVEATFVVYSSQVAIWELVLENRGDTPASVTAYPYYIAPESGIRELIFRTDRSGFRFLHREPPEQWSETPLPQYEPDLANLFLVNVPVGGFGGYPAGEDAFLKEAAKRDFLGGDLTGAPRALALEKFFRLGRGERGTIRIVRAVEGASKPAGSLEALAREALALPSAQILSGTEALYQRIPRLPRLSREEQLVYLGAFNLVRQMMMPPEGACRRNYYVFSREPTWGWGHDGQVFHESLSMLAYVFMDPPSAMDSQRVFAERQREDGYIGYRIGPYVNRTFPFQGEDTTSAPFYNWTNWEVYRVAGERRFLEEAYESGARFARWFIKNRDRDRDGLFEWGGHAILECVRDGFNAVYDLFGGTADVPRRFEALDLSLMMVKELRSFEAMAGELRKSAEAREWKERADRLAKQINETMWDPDSGFYYHVARDTHRMELEGQSLKRKEIIGFLPLWAGVASKEQAERLVSHLKNPASFARRFGVPTLAADDPHYDPYVTRCCQWNGAVWLLWDYLVFRGLLDYGYRAEAEDVYRRVLEAVAWQLRANHRFWESYSPDYTKLESPMSYIWDGIIARFMIDLN